jgi:crotonobetainyl-CoA:carnitine CoA-transferase CaiB-like acyl-CoA transferase
VSALEGVKVLDLTRLLPGGFCTLLLADFGADVLKVEDTGMGDYVRWAPPQYEGADDSANSSLFLALNRNKRSVRINLKEERGREVLLRLVKEYDVVIESFRPGVMDRLGVGYERLRDENPRVIYCAITGYGQDGPYRDRSGHDMNYLGLIGLLGLTGEQGGPPIQSAGQIADLGGGALMGAFGVLAALHERERSGEGQLVDVSMADGALAWLAMVAGRYFADGVVPQRGELDQPGTEGVKQLGVPVKMSRTPGGLRAPGPVLGQHTHEVLAATGYSEAEIADLEQTGAVGGPAAGVEGSFMG